MNYAPTICGLVDLAPRVDELMPFIDWGSLLFSWGFRGTLEGILADSSRAEKAEALLADAKDFLKTHGTLLQPKGVCGVFPCERRGDDIVVDHQAVLHTLRQQQQKPAPAHYYALADFVKSEDYIGMFVVTAGAGWDALLDEARAKKDDYTVILGQTLAARIAEAAAEWVHMKMRREIWGYVPDEDLSPAELLKPTTPIQGIRPAPGYACLPDHSEKWTIFRLLNAEKRVGVALTESSMMMPEASVCALCFARPETVYFAVGRIGEDQFEDYRKRKQWDRATALKWLNAVYSE